MKIDLHYGLDPSFGPRTHELRGVGGTESFVTYSAYHLEKVGSQDITVYNKTRAGLETFGQTGRWQPVERFDPEAARDVLLSFRLRDVFQQPLPQTRLKVIALADTESYGLGEDVRAGRIDLVMFVSRWQAEKIAAEEGLNLNDHLITSNGVVMDAFREYWSRECGKCVHMSTPERGLSLLLDLWPQIQARVPFAELHLFSSFFGWGVSAEDNDRMCRDVYKRIDNLRDQGLRIFNHQHVSASEMRTQLLTSELFLYPTNWFNETCCISALEAAAAGVPIVATARAALQERVEDGVTGYLIPEGPSHDEMFVDKAAELLFNEKLMESMSRRSVNYAEYYDYEMIVRRWLDRWGNELALRR